MNVLVTGGAGYIGSVICDQLLADGHGVVVIDNLSKGHRDAVAERATFVEADLLDRSAVVDTLARHQVDAVIHMAASSLVGESMSQPSKYYRNNLWATLGLLEAMTYSGTRRLVFSSTAAVYGNPEKQPIEEHDPTVPTNPYGDTKLAVERALHWYSLAHGLQFVALRYFNAAGATRTRGERHSPETHLIPLVLDAAAKNTSVAVFGNDYPTKDGTCVRDYVHVSDLARAHVLALSALADGAPSATFNLGCGQGYSVTEVVDAARRVTGRPITIDVQARRAGDPAVLVASSAKIRETLGWTPEHERLDDIVGSAWAWMRTFDATAGRYSAPHPTR
ncbi:MAG TPA: UDP-glucose 4-epimerase GalE [Vicinamibacterales bacterium]|nr:UDP-glucose 4-epimerase GalE [Vicinamibacterales bacterium]